jgi:hypothetical protein
VSQIVWLASYPKSGNTWLRAFLTNFQRDDGEPADINKLETDGIASNRSAVDDALGVESSDMTEDEIERHRPAAYRYIAKRSNETLLLKIHDAYTLRSGTSGAEPLIPEDVTRGVVYIVRNPLDVAISFAHHSAWTVDQAIARMARETMALSAEPHRLHRQLKQRLLSWSQHVLSWLDQNTIPLHVMRYEDMCRQPLETFHDAVRFIGLGDDLDRVRRATTLSCFEELQQQERRNGFKEKSANMESPFFRNGQAGGWRDVLTKSQAARIIEDHGPVMQRLGYLSEDGLIQ